MLLAAGVAPAVMPPQGFGLLAREVQAMSSPASTRHVSVLSCSVQLARLLPEGLA